MSRRKMLALIGVLALVMLAGVACENWCREQYDLISSDECPIIPQQPPGPPIILEPETGGPTLKWSVDGDSPDHVGSIWDSCDLRTDFMGVGVIQFEFYESRDDTAYLSAKKVRVSNDDITAWIIRTETGIRWQIKQKGVPTPELCDPTPRSIAVNELPMELEGLKIADLYEEHHGKKGEKLKITVKIPAEQ